MRSKSILVLMVMLSVVNNSLATTVRGIDIDFVTIGNPGNPGDNRAEANPGGAGRLDGDESRDEPLHMEDVRHQPEENAENQGDRDLRIELHAPTRRWVCEDGLQWPAR